MVILCRTSLVRHRAILRTPPHHPKTDMQRSAAPVPVCAGSNRKFGHDRITNSVDESKFSSPSIRPWLVSDVRRQGIAAFERCTYNGAIQYVKFNKRCQIVLNSG